MYTYTFQNCEMKAGHEVSYSILVKSQLSKKDPNIGTILSQIQERNANSF